MKIWIGFKGFIQRVVKIIGRSDMQILPGQLAFSFILMLVPILALFGTVLSFFNLSGDYVSSVIIEYLPKAAGDLIIGLSDGSGGIQMHNIVVIITSLILASGGTSSMIAASNSIYKIKRKGLIYDRVKSIVMLLFLLILFIIVLLVPVFGNMVFNVLSELLDSNMGSISLLVFKLLKYPLSFLLIFAIVKLIYVMAPDIKIKSKDVTYGALFTTIVWIFATVIYAFYVENFANYTNFYGGISSIIVLMLWMYILAYVFVLGMALNAYKHDIEEKKESHN